MAMNIKTEPKDVGLVSSSMMLVNNPVTEYVSSYYPDSSSNMAAPGCTTSAAEDYHYHQPLTNYYGGPFSYGTYNPYTYTSSATYDVVTRTTPPNCSCESVPPQQSFLHQILTGQGYKNDKLFVSIRPVIKQERDTWDYRGYYGYRTGYGFPMYY